jgi:DNA-binding NarL/FixJ family response regulator
MQSKWGCCHGDGWVGFTPIMEKRSVVLICTQQLFGESLETLLSSSGDIGLIGPWDLQVDVCERLSACHPDVVVIIEDPAEIDCAGALTNQIMHRYPDLPVILLGVDQNVFYIINTQALPASGPDLLNTIRRLPVEKPRTSGDARGH